MDEAVRVARTPGGVVAVDEIGVVLGGEALARRLVEVARGIAMRRALRRTREASAGGVAFAGAAIAPLRPAFGGFGLDARERRAGSDDDRHRAALVRAVRLADPAVVDHGPGVVAHGDRPERVVGRHVEAGAAHAAIEQPLVLARHRVPEALAVAVAQVGNPQRLPRQAPEALGLPAVAAL